mmetsp:Transcript_49387/g.87003  ORF Transcript_49387/g.87003 Transcript_49387/m.87003 type:complete len:152 (+) Transcript_49387:72-527(+)
MVRCPLLVVAVAINLVEAKIWYEKMVEKQGFGECVDKSGFGYEYWAGELPFEKCEKLCTEDEFCVGFDYHHKEDVTRENMPENWCELRYQDGKKPSESPNGFWLKHGSDHSTGSGPVAGVRDDSGHVKRCYAKRGKEDWEDEEMVKHRTEL